MTRDEFVKIYKVGDKINISGTDWPHGKFLEILCLGNDRFFSRDNYGQESSWFYGNNIWELYTEPKKTVKMAQALYQRTDDGTFFINGDFFKSKEEAKEYYTSSSYKIVQWPLVINGVEQWVEVEE